MGRPDVLAELKQRHDKGDRRAVLDTLDHCFSSRPIKEVPEWVRKAFCNAYAEIFNALVGSWDDVFGKPEGYLKTRRRRKELAFPIWHRVRDLHASGQALDDDMFAAVAKEFGVGARQAKSIFYGFENAVGYRSNLWGPPPRARRRKASVPQK
jgi:hypothetical protein